VQHVAFSPDGQRLASGAGRFEGQPKDAAGEVKIWDAQTGKELLSLTHTHVISGVAFSPDGQRLASCGGPGSFDDRKSNPGEVKVWDARTGREFLALKTAGHVDRVAFSPDGRHL